MPSKSQPFQPHHSHTQLAVTTWCIRWSKTPARERSAVMMKIADLVEARIDEFAVAESRDQGKPVWLAKAVDINRVCLNFRFFASGILHCIDTYVSLISTGPTEG